MWKLWVQIYTLKYSMNNILIPPKNHINICPFVTTTIILRYYLVLYLEGIELEFCCYSNLCHLDKYQYTNCSHVRSMQSVSFHFSSLYFMINEMQILLSRKDTIHHLCILIWIHYPKMSNKWKVCSACSTEIS